MKTGRQMLVADFAAVIETARIVYQVALGDGHSLIDPDHLRVDVCPPGVGGLSDPDGPTPGTWRVTIGEDNDGGLARGEGASLAEAIASIAEVVDQRRIALMASIDEARAG